MKRLIYFISFIAVLLICSCGNSEKSIMPGDDVNSLVKAGLCEKNTENTYLINPEFGGVKFSNAGFHFFSGKVKNVKYLTRIEHYDSLNLRKMRELEGQYEQLINFMSNKFGDTPETRKDSKVGDHDMWYIEKTRVWTDDKGNRYELGIREEKEWEYMPKNTHEGTPTDEKQLFTMLGLYLYIE